MVKKTLYIFIILLVKALSITAQCPQFYNSAGVATSTPYWIGCAGGNYTIFVQPTTAITGGYTIDWGDGSASTSGTNLLPSGFESHTYTATVDTFPVIITTVSPACTINGVVVMELTPSASIQIPLGNPVFGCTPKVFSFQNASTNVSKTTKFIWTFGDGSTDENYDYTNLGQTVNHNYLPGVSGCNLAVTLKAENYCNRGNPSSNVYQPLQVWDKDEVQITPDAFIKCSPSTTFHFNNTTILNCNALGNNQQRFEYWNFGDYWGLGHDSIVNWQPFSPPNRAGYSITYPGLGTYDVSLTDSSFCGTKETTISVEIIAPPTAGLALDHDSICVGTDVVATNLSTANASEFVWNFGDGSGAYTVTDFDPQTHTYTTPGNYTITLIANISGATGCTSTITKSINIKPSPVSNFTLDSNNFCDSGIETFTNHSTGVISTYAWDFGNGNTSALVTPPPQSYPTMGSYAVSLTLTGTNGCLATSTGQVDVYSSPDAEASPFSSCVGSLGTFSDASTTAPGDFIASWLWTFGDNVGSSTLQNPDYAYADTGSYKVKLTVSTTYCSNTDSIIGIVYPYPFANYSQTIDSGCTPLIVSFTNLSTGALSYIWDFGDGTSDTSSTTFNHTFINPGVNDTVYHISLASSAASGCTATYTTDVTVYHAAHAAFTSNYSVNCSPLSVQFTDASEGATGYSWNFGDGSALTTTQSPAHIFVNSTPFIKTDTTTLTVSSLNGCSNIITQNILIYPAPTFSFVGIPLDTGCTPLNISFVASSGGALYQWDFGDGTTSLSQSISHTFLSNGNTDSVYHVTLISTSPFLCKDTTKADVLVHPSPTADFLASLTSGCSPLTVNFTDQSMMAATYKWDFGDGASSTTASTTHTFVNNTLSTITYNVSFEVTTVSGCTDTMIKQIQVYPNVVAAFENPGNACSPFSISIQNNSTNATSYSWDFGDGTTSVLATPNHTYTNLTASNITNTITLIAQSSLGCADTALQPVIVYYKPNANFNLVSDTGCSPFIVNFNDASIGAANNDWVFGDGSVANGVTSPTHTYVNLTGGSITTTAQLITTTANFCADTMTHLIHIYPQVVADFIEQTAGCSPLNLTLTNQSGNANTYNWDLGDGTFSTQTNPLHTYINNSISDTNLTITLIANSNGGCSDTVQKNITVFYKPQSDFNTSVVSGCHPLPVNFFDQSSGGAHYYWDFGDLSSVDTTLNPMHVYTNTSLLPITYIARLVVTTTEGCADTTTQSIVVYPAVTAAFAGATNGCSPLNISLISQSINATTFNWDFGDGTFSTQTNPSITYINASSNSQTYTIQLIATSASGCADTTNTTVSVVARPDASFTATPISQIYPSTTVSVTNTSSSGNWNYNWSWDDGNTSTQQNPASNTYATWGVYTITLIMGTASCIDTAINTVTVIPPLPVATFTMPPYNGCQPEKICFTNTSQYAISSTWEFGDGNSSNTASPCYTYFSAGTFNVVLTILGPGGQLDTASTTVVINPKPVANFAASLTTVQVPSTATQFMNLSTDATSYLWNFGDGNTSVETSPSNYLYTQAGQYDVTLIANNQYGCADTLTKFQYINAKLISDIVIPNAFTPNSNGPSGGTYDPLSYDNDVFFPYSLNGITEYHLMVYNRWGELVFDTKDLMIGWDGYYKGKICTPDVYVWKVEGRYPDGTKYQKAGDVTLIK
jgi:PKD repeat protein